MHPPEAIAPSNITDATMNARRAKALRRTLPCACLSPLLPPRCRSAMAGRGTRAVPYSRSLAWLPIIAWALDKSRPPRSDLTRHLANNKRTAIVCMNGSAGNVTLSCMTGARGLYHNTEVGTYYNTENGERSKTNRYRRRIMQSGLYGLAKILT